MQTRDFKDRVDAVVKSIPEKRVMSYGQIAAICGSPRAARIVGGIAHYGNPELPWHRVVSKDGNLASGYPGGKEGHRQVLESEGFEVKDYKINIERHIWHPK